MTDLEYLREGISRIETRKVKAGSHAAGIFAQCAAVFETEIRAWFTRLLQSCGLDYDKGIKTHCKQVALDKTTLGNLIAGIKRAASVKPACIGQHIPSSDNVTSFLQKLHGINEDWVRMKHRGEVEIATIFERMKAMEQILVEVTVDAQSRGDA